MGSAWLLATTLCASITCCWAVAVPRGPVVEGKPEFAPYQDMGKCLSRGSTWYVFYRTVKEGAFGTNDRCLRDTQLSDSVDGKARFRFRFGDNHERNATFHFKTSDGTNQNKFEALVDGEECPLPMKRMLSLAKNIVKYNLLYVDCDHCKIMKCPTSLKCLMSVRESGLRHGVPQHCKFLYGTLCGPSPKYQISDSSCLTDNKA